MIIIISSSSSGSSSSSSSITITISKYVHYVSVGLGLRHCHCLFYVLSYYGVGVVVRPGRGSFLPKPSTTAKQQQQSINNT